MIVVRCTRKLLQLLDGTPADSVPDTSAALATWYANVVETVGGDIIVGVDGRPVQDSRELTIYLETKTRVGDTVELTIIRDGQEERLEVQLDQRPD